MNGSLRAVWIWSAVCALGVLAALVRMIAAPSTPLPRWDLVGCLGTAAVGALGGRRAVRKRPDRGATAYWWPGRRPGLIGGGFLVWLLVVVALVTAPLSFAPDAWRMREAGYTIRALPVEKVLSTESHGGRTTYFLSDVRIAVPFDSGDVTTTVSLRTEHRPEEGSRLRVWVLYVPSVKELGWITSHDRAELEAEVGGPADPVSVTIVALGMGIGLALAAAWGRTTGGGLAGLTRRGHGRSLPVTVVGAGAANGERREQGKPLEQAAPRLVLLTPSEEEAAPQGCTRLEFFLDPALDSAVLAPDAAAPLIGSGARVCRAERTARATRRGAHGAPSADAVLLLDDGRFAQGKLQTAAGEPLPDGARMPTMTAEAARAQARSALPTPPWDPLLHPRSFSALLLGLLLLAATAYGVGSFWTKSAGAVAVLAPPLAWLSVVVGRSMRWTDRADAEARAESGEAAPSKEPPVPATVPSPVPAASDRGGAAVPPTGPAPADPELPRALRRMCLWAALTAAALGTAWSFRDGDHQTVALIALLAGFALLRPLYVSARALRALRLAPGSAEAAPGARREV
ncbi:hypothetical protein [Streptomyces sp. NPDC007083]|uniref:hypothetical protein n=1 Tax=unclassified Streptomyces TaxID=2593676 RepID=UPI0033DC3773